MEKNENAERIMEQANTGVSNSCIACLEPIRPGARICRHCGTSQVAHRWQTVGNILKWVGGITAIISLIAASVRINELYIGWHEKRVVVEELVMAAQLQLETSDYPNAWEFLDQALSLEPASRIARQEQINLAMVWVRHMEYDFGNKNFIKIIEKLMSVLYRGAASEDPHNAAMISAHLGLADMLRAYKEIEVKDIDAHFKRSFKLDPENFYASLMYANWLLSSVNPDNTEKNSVELVELAATHFQKALDLKKSREYVRRIQMDAYLNSGYIEGKIKAYETALIMINDGETFRISYRNNLKRSIMKLAIDEKDEFFETAVEKNKPDNLLKVVQWVSSLTRGEYEKAQWSYIRARLVEESGDVQAAIKLYRELISELGMLSASKYLTLSRKRLRQIELKKNICYVPMLVVYTGGLRSHPSLKALHPGDILLSYDGLYIHNRDELKQAQELVGLENEVRLVFMRDASPVIFNIKPEDFDFQDASKISLRLSFQKMQVSEKALGEYANTLCGK